MKHILLSALVIGFTFNACKSKKTSAKTTSGEPTEMQLTALKTKVLDATMEDLQKGHNVFYGACTKCHGTKNVTEFSEQQLKETIDKMAPKANINDDEKQAVWKYALALNLAAKK
ncbi:MAG: hypothetical protein ACXVNM_11525 [Bacteroidia bacterium]